MVPEVGSEPRLDVVHRAPRGCPRLHGQAALWGRVPPMFRPSEVDTRGPGMRVGGCVVTCVSAHMCAGSEGGLQERDWPRPFSLRANLGQGSPGHPQALLPPAGPGAAFVASVVAAAVGSRGILGTCLWRAAEGGQPGHLWGLDSVLRGRKTVTFAKPSLGLGDNSLGTGARLAAGSTWLCGASSTRARPRDPMQAAGGRVPRRSGSRSQGHLMASSCCLFAPVVG